MYRVGSHRSRAQLIAKLLDDLGAERLFRCQTGMALIAARPRSLTHRGVTRM
jgi:hypothetical protein